MKSFVKGALAGAVAATAAVASGIVAIHKQVVEPAEKEEERFDENRKAANRKGRSAHL